MAFIQRMSECSRQRILKVYFSKSANSRGTKIFFPSVTLTAIKLSKVDSSSPPQVNSRDRSLLWRLGQILGVCSSNNTTSTYQVKSLSSLALLLSLSHTHTHTHQRTRTHTRAHLSCSTVDRRISGRTCPCTQLTAKMHGIAFISRDFMCTEHRWVGLLKKYSKLTSW